MKLTGFRIKNFRSINDTKWQDLSSDGITCLIGQNESGKTSILQALDGFYSESLEDDDLQVGRPLPEVACAFAVSMEEIKSHLVASDYTADFAEEFASYCDGRINLVRRWSSVDQSTLDLEESQLRQRVKEYLLRLDEEKRLALISEAQRSQSEARNLLEIEADNEAPSPVSDNVDAQVNEVSSATSINAKAEIPSIAENEMIVDHSLQTASVSPQLPVPAPNSPPEQNNGTADGSYDKSSQLILLANRLFKLAPQFSYFEDFTGLLPDNIDHADIIAQKSAAQGRSAALNVFAIVGLDFETLPDAKSNARKVAIQEANASITANFREFWSQNIGENQKVSIDVEIEHYSSDTQKPGLPYFEFWVKDVSHTLHPKQRSKGLRWFLSFFLELKARATENPDRGRVLLIDEPGGSLHERAQDDLLKVLDEIKGKIQIVYTTHSPHLIKLDALYRLLAVERSQDSSGLVATSVLNYHKLGSASRETLSPIYRIIGADFSSQNVIGKNNNIILEEISALYYFRAFSKLVSLDIDHIHFIPAQGVKNVPFLANLLIGWGLTYGVVVDGDRSGKEVFKELKRDFFGNDERDASASLLVLEEFEGVEDILSKTDFKRHVLDEPEVSIQEKNSKYVRGMSKAVLALKFMRKVMCGDISASDLEQSSIDAINNVLASVVTLQIAYEPPI